MTTTRTRVSRMAAAACTGALLVGALASTAQADSDREYWSWTWEDADVTPWVPDDDGGESHAVRLRNGDGGVEYSALFQSYGEVLFLQDHRSDGHAVVAYLQVEGNGTAVFRGEDDYNLSFDEGLDYRVKVCVDGHLCSGWSAWGTT